MEDYGFTSFLADVSSFLSTVADGIALFMEPPLVWFVVMGAAAAAIGIAKRLIPRKRAR